MASKKGVVMYYDILEQLEDFTDEQFGKITRAIIKYDKTGEVPEFDDPSLKVVFKFMKPTLDRNKKEYEDICEKRRISGSLGGKQKVANASKCYQNLANLADNDNDNDIENDKDNKKEILKKEIAEVIAYLNEKVGTRFGCVDSNTKEIKARFSENYKIEDFKTVIDKKCAEWLGTEQQKYLRPETLFCKKHFDGYLNGLSSKDNKPKFVRKEATDEEKEDYLRVIREREEMFKI